MLTGSHAARNWIGVVGAYISDAVLQFFGIGAFLLAVFPVMLGVRWFRSRKIQSPTCQNSWRNLAADVCSGLVGAFARSYPLDACDPD